MQKPRQSLSQRPAYTVIELLVVIVIIAIFIGLLLALCMPPNQLVNDKQVTFQVSRNEVANRFLSREKMFQTCYCEFELIEVPTTPEHAIELRKRLRNLLSQEQINGRIRSEAQAKERSRFKKVWMKQNKYRIEKMNLYPEYPYPTYTITYDGQIIREFSNDQNKPTGGISTTKTKQWEQSPFEDPVYRFLFFYSTPLSKLIEDSPIFQWSVADKNSQYYQMRISSEKGQMDFFDLDFILDKQFRILERIDTGNNKKHNIKYHHQRILFEDYKDVPTDSGKKMSFPFLITFIKYDEALCYGDILEKNRSICKIRSLQFDVDMDDSLFELEIPKTALVYDNVTGLGWLPPGERPANLFPQDARRRLWWTIGIVGLVITTFLAWLTIRYRNRRRLLA